MLTGPERSASDRRVSERFRIGSDLDKRQKLVLPDRIEFWADSPKTAVLLAF